MDDYIDYDVASGRVDFTILHGKTVEAIYMSRKDLTFITDKGPVSFAVTAECCSTSYFFDFYGVENLLGSVVTGFERVYLSPGDPGYNSKTHQTKPKGNPKSKTSKKVAEKVFTKVYGYRLTTEHPVFGDVSSVISFRNDSNGYYGGSMNSSTKHVTDENFRIMKDKIG